MYKINIESLNWQEWGVMVVGGKGGGILMLPVSHPPISRGEGVGVKIKHNGPISLLSLK